MVAFARSSIEGEFRLHEMSQSVRRGMKYNLRDQPMVNLPPGEIPGPVRASWKDMNLVSGLAPANNYISLSQQTVQENQRWQII